MLQHCCARQQINPPKYRYNWCDRESNISSLEAESRVLSRPVGDLEALRPAAGDGGAGMVNVRGVVVGLVGLAPALEGPP